MIVIIIIIMIIFFEGPSTWAKNFPTAAGSRQSPVDIVTSLATSDTSLTSKPLSWKYVPENIRTIVNTGHGWRVDIDSEGSGKGFEYGAYGYFIYERFKAIVRESGRMQGHYVSSCGWRMLCEYAV
jgi:carbonic anhydrase